MTDEGQQGPNREPNQSDQTGDLNQQIRRSIRQERRIGRFPGAGPRGSATLSYEDLPGDEEALKNMYLELQRTLRDNEARRYQDIQRHRLFGDDDALQDLLSHFWNRGLELIFIGGAFITLITQIRPSVETPLAVGVLTTLALWERFVRTFLEILWRKIGSN